MKALQLLSKEKKVHLVDVPVPKITQPDDVLIKVAYSGICGTDLHIIEGRFPIREDPPLILGHEFSGTVADFGIDVLNFQKGDRVVADPNNCCGSCEFCHLGKPHFCTGTNRNIGTFVDGGFAEYIVVPARMVHKLPEKLNLKQGALVEPLSCISHGLDKVEPISVGSKILVTGAGIIGTLWACVLSLKGHINVTVCDPNVARLNTIKGLDLDFCLVTPEELKDKRKKNPNYTFHFVVDCSGHGPIIEYGISLLERGGKYCCFGVASPDTQININPYNFFRNELTIMGVKINPYSFSKALGLAESMSKRYLDYDLLDIKLYELEEYETALNDLKTGRVLKGMFKIDCLCYEN